MATDTIVTCKLRKGVGTGDRSVSPVPPDRSFHYPLIPCCYHHIGFHVTGDLCSRK